MAVDTLTMTLGFQVQINAQKNITPTVGSPTTNPSSFTKNFTIGTGVANNAAGGGDEPIFNIVTITGGGSTTLDFTSITNILAQTAQNLARIKLLSFQLLSATDDSVNGTAATYVTLGNNGSNDFISQSGTGWLGSASSTFAIPNGGMMGFATPAAAGVAVDGTHKIEKIANGDGAVTAAVQYVVGGGSS